MRLLVRIVGRVLRVLSKLRAKRASRAISKVELLECLSGYERVEDFLHDFRSRKEPSFFLRKENLPLLEEVLPQSEEAIIRDADEICAHNFDLLGSGKRNVSELASWRVKELTGFQANRMGGNTETGKLADYQGIAWHRDFKTGIEWAPSVLHSDIVIIKGDGSDIKVPWELSRFQHLPTLGKSYWLTGDERYAGEFVNEIEDWIESNPPLYGVNWACTMDVAIRAVNWIWGYHFFKESRQITNEFLLKFLKSLLIHGRHIRGNLERSWRSINGNHYLSDIVGLVYLGVMFPEFKEAKKWHDFGIEELIKEMERQVYPEGVHYEGSISYNKLVTELFLSATLLCIKNGITFPKWYMERLERMIEFVMYYTKPDGTAPQIGDNDDGRLHILANYGSWNRLDHRYLLAIGAVLFNRPDFKQAAGEFHEESFWLLGEEGLKKFCELSDQGIPISSKAFPYGGFHIMRNENLYWIVDCVPADPKAPSGHKHNSRLSFELFAYDKSFIVDPGAYIYTANKDMRNLFRSTRYHNTVVVDGEEQNRFDENELFSLGRAAAVRVNHWEATEEYDILDAEHSGYKMLKNPVTHRRLIFFNKREGYWVVKDILTGRGFHHFDLYFHFAPLEIELDSDFPLVVKTRVQGANLAIIPLEIEGISVELLKGWVSYRYAVKVKAPIARYSKKSLAPTSFCNVIYPCKAEIEIGRIREKVQGAASLKLAFSNIDLPGG